MIKAMSRALRDPGAVSDPIARQKVYPEFLFLGDWQSALSARSDGASVGRHQSI